MLQQIFCSGIRNNKQQKFLGIVENFSFFCWIFMLATVFIWCIDMVHSCWHNPLFLMFPERSPLSLLTAVWPWLGPAILLQLCFPGMAVPGQLFPKPSCVLMYPCRHPGAGWALSARGQGWQGRLWRWESSRRLKQHKDS